MGAGESIIVPAARWQLWTIEDHLGDSPLLFTPSRFLAPDFKVASQAGGSYGGRLYNGGGFEVATTNLREFHTQQLSNFSHSFTFMAQWDAHSNCSSTY